MPTENTGNVQNAKSRNRVVGWVSCLCGKNGLVWPMVFNMCLVSEKGENKWRRPVKPWDDTRSGKAVNNSEPRSLIQRPPDMWKISQMCNALRSNVKLPLDANSLPMAWGTVLGERWQCHLRGRWGWWYFLRSCFPDCVERRPPRKGHGYLLVGEASFPGNRSIRDALCPSLLPTGASDIPWTCTLNGCETWKYSSVFHNQNLWAELEITAKNWWTRS